MGKKQTISLDQPPPDVTADDGTCRRPWMIASWHGQRRLSVNSNVSICWQLLACLHPLDEGAFHKFCKVRCTSTIYVKSLELEVGERHSSKARQRKGSAMADTTCSPTMTLYTAATPNGIKVSMALEVLGLVSWFSFLQWVCRPLSYCILICKCHIFPLWVL